MNTHIHCVALDGTAIESLAMSLCCCLELLAEGNKAMHQASLQWRLLMSDYLLLEHTCALDVTSKLQQTLSHKTALYCKKLIKVRRSVLPSRYQSRAHRREGMQL